MKTRSPRPQSIINADEMHAKTGEKTLHEGRRLTVGLSNVARQGRLVGLSWSVCRVRLENKL
eukprot:scaffold18152_cov88-Phaeocystis_antarctica.AAC.7